MKRCREFPYRCDKYVLLVHGTGQTRGFRASTETSSEISSGLCVLSFKAAMQLNEPRRPEGTPIGEYLQALVECNPCILALSLVTYYQPPSIELRAALSATDIARLDRALNLRQRSEEHTSELQSLRHL